MNETRKHTPAPWRVAEGGHNILHDPPDGGRPKMVAAVFISNDTSPTFKDREELKANARLVAAAPELLEACQRMLHGLWIPTSLEDHAVEREEACRMARAAIAKATEVESEAPLPA